MYIMVVAIVELWSAGKIILPECITFCVHLKRPQLCNHNYSMQAPTYPCSDASLSVFFEKYMYI